MGAARFILPLFPFSSSPRGVVAKWRRGLRSLGFESGKSELEAFLREGDTHGRIRL